MTTKEQLEDRYGRTPRIARRRVGWLLVALIGSALVAALAWTTVSNSLDDVSYDDTGYEIVDDHTVTVSFQVGPPANTPFVCALQALDEDFGVVGWRVIEFAAIKTTAKAFVESIPTVARATTGVVHSCWVN
ncbi:DUF4307 domain-containing protein [Microbacterium yannicii]|uniref:DUF4307 domain-containing protein n=1 Tax=Microbacterium yannicii TaxID=671622 RepID=UPI00037D8DAD|nr:DUF4307 domain-containing protein [Microbacterium yannicii]